jgi:hypothetical protein
MMRDKFTIMNKDVDIEIKCPVCKKKASFFANEKVVRNTVVVPSLQGTVICFHCGANKNFTFSNNDYYYQVRVEKRILFARTLEHLLFLKTYFEEKKRTDDFSLDFPKTFYKSREEIVEKINMIIKKEGF